MALTVALSRLKTRILRNCWALSDGSFVLAVVCTAAFLAFEIDVFETAPGLSSEDRLLELDEVLALGMLLSIGLLLFGWRRLLEQKRETQRRIHAEREARTLAMQDSLTGLPNRRHFESALNAAIAAPPGAGACHAIFALDLNGFKKVNDVHGHGTGDEVLIHIAGRFARTIREGDMVARLGGDEFIIVARHLTGADEAMGIGLRIIESLSEPVTLRSGQHRVGTGIGIALFPQDATTASEILRKADIALYRSKADGISSLRFFEPQMDSKVRERDQLEREMRAAIGTASLQPFYQPMVDLKSNKVVGFEASPRWCHPTLGELEPERFVTIAEDSGLIGELSDALLEQACRDALTWPAELTLSFNIFPTQIKDRTLGMRILAILGRVGLSPQRLELEITESALVRDMDVAQETIGALRQSGIRIALDGFGTGYSSLYHLRNFKLDKIKIDRSFVESMSRDRESESIVRALVGLGAGLSLTVTAEGVANSEQQSYLMAQGCDQAQGYLFSRALPASEALALLADKKAAVA